MIGPTSGGRMLRLGAVALPLLLLGASGVQAADEPANLIKYRQAVMSAIGGHMSAIAGVAKGEVSFTEDVEGHAHAIHEMSKTLLRQYPKGSGPEAGDTRALPSIWEKWSDFEAATKRLQDESAKMIEVAKSGDAAAIGRQTGILGKEGCGGCHKPFRKEQ